MLPVGAPSSETWINNDDDDENENDDDSKEDDDENDGDDEEEDDDNMVMVMMLSLMINSTVTPYLEVQRLPAHQEDLDVHTITLYILNMTC